MRSKTSQTQNPKISFFFLFALLPTQPCFHLPLLSSNKQNPPQPPLAPLPLLPQITIHRESQNKSSPPSILTFHASSLSRRDPQSQSQIHQILTWDLSGTFSFSRASLNHSTLPQDLQKFDSPSLPIATTNPRNRLLTCTVLHILVQEFFPSYTIPVPETRTLHYMLPYYTRIYTYLPTSFHIYIKHLTKEETSPQFKDLKSNPWTHLHNLTSFPKIETALFTCMHVNAAFLRTINAPITQGWKNQSPRPAKLTGITILQTPLVQIKI